MLSLSPAATKMRAAVIKFAVQSGNANRITGMLSQAEPHLVVAADDLDRDPNAAKLFKRHQ
jgi:hypothetical protein